MKARLDRERLVKLLGLLGSEHGGEVGAAGRHADALIKRAGLTWRDVLISALPQITAVSFGVVDDITFCLQRRHRLNEWEAQFIASLREQHFPPTTRQRNKLNAIVDKVRRRAEAA